MAGTFEQKADHLRTQSPASSRRAVAPVASRSGWGPASVLGLQRSVGNAAATAALRSVTPIQRYQAGEHGHGGIEQQALRQAGFTGSMGEGEIGAVYLGNWMRDFSQIGDAHSTAILTVLNVLSMGEFNRPVTAEQVGGYLPSEHLDNPRGGGSVEDPIATQMPMQDWNGLSSPQQAWVREEQTDTFRTEMANRASRTHLPAYIEAGKEHARRELVMAARAGRDNPTGSLAMGNGLHTIEDYFAHSNFTDACIYMLAAEGALPSSSPVLRGLQARARQLGYDPSGGIAGGQRRPEVMTGTYRSEGNKRVSLLEQLRSEIETGALRRAAIVGAVRLGMVNGGDRGSQGGRAVGSALVGSLAAVGGTLVEGTSGAGSGAARGWRENHGLRAISGAAEGFFSDAVSQGEAGAREGWREGSAAGGRGGEAAGRIVGEGLGAAVEATVIGGLVSIISGLITVIRAQPGVDRAGAAAADDASQSATNTATRNDRAAESRQASPYLGPNHSQLAKDDTDHPAFAASRALAVHVDAEIGRAMIAAWGAHASGESVEHLRGLVDRFVCNPAEGDWWRPPLGHALGIS